jgi:hypothetical protein
VDAQRNFKVDPKAISAINGEKKAILKESLTIKIEISKND